MCADKCSNKFNKCTHFRGHGAAVLCVQFDENKIVSGSCDKFIKVSKNLQQVIY